MGYMYFLEFSAIARKREVEETKLKKERKRRSEKDQKATKG